MVWKLILPIGTKSSKFGKWSPTWEGPFRVNICVPGNAYILETLEGEEYSRGLNGKYLKKYYPSVWVAASKKDTRIFMQPVHIFATKFI